MHILEQVAISTIADQLLLEAVVNGISVCFEMGASPWLANWMPSQGTNIAQAQMPMGDNVYGKQVPSDGPHALGQVTNAGKNYTPGAVTQFTQTTRNIGEETRAEKPGYKFPQIQYKSPKGIKQMEKTASKHIPVWGQNSFTPINYYANAVMRGPWDGQGGSQSIASGGGTIWTA